MKTKLLPCPFCGSEAKRIRSVATCGGVRCSGCPAMIVAATPKAAVTAWNARMYGGFASANVFRRVGYDDGSEESEVAREWLRKVASSKLTPGQLHRDLGVPAGSELPARKLRAAAKLPGAIGKRARFALNLRKGGKL